MAIKIISRDLLKPMRRDAEEKIILLSGPRQVGKTVLAKHLSKSCEYLNYDNDAHKLLIQKSEWNRDAEILIFDELHKMDGWKAKLKGVYDVEGIPPRMIVTGSARLETYTNVGDSLAGRFFSFRLHPLDLRELVQVNARCDRKKKLESLMRYSGFPEPFFKASEAFYKRWCKTHLDAILREDFLGMLGVGDISKLRLLIEILRRRVGSPISYASIARDIGHCSGATVKRWVELLEKLYIVFKVPPYSKSVARSLLKEPKFYFFNSAYVHGDEGARFENLVACALLKKIHYLEDVEGKEGGLYYLKNKDKREVDFFCVVGNSATMVEVKVADDSFSKDLLAFQVPQFDEIQRIQLVKKCGRTKSKDRRTKLVDAAEWLCSVEIGD